MSQEHRRYLFQGRVQGVGFRMTTRRIAQAHPVTGYVRNLPDGQVEVVVAGEPPAIAAFLKAIRDEFPDEIESIESEPWPTHEPLGAGFVIRH